MIIQKSAIDKQGEQDFTRH